MKQKHIIVLLVFPVLLLNSCGTFDKATSINPQTNYFPAKANKKVSVLRQIPVRADTLRTLLIVNSDSYFLQMGRYMNYFKEVMTIAELQDQIIKGNNVSII